MKPTKENTALRAIHNTLAIGGSYFEDHYGYDYDVLWTDEKRECLHFRNFGSSAKEFTLENLKWILENIFEMTAVEFKKNYKANIRGIIA